MKSRGRILLVTLDGLEGGGVGTVLSKLRDAWTEHGWHVEAVRVLPPVTHNGRAGLRLICRFNGWRWLPTFAFSYLHRRRASSMHMEARELAADVVIYSHPRAAIIVPPQLFPSSQTVGMYHDSARTARQRGHVQEMRIGYSSVHACVALTSMDAARLSQWTGRLWQSIPNPAPTVLSPTTFQHRSCDFCFVGRLAPQKQPNVAAREFLSATVGRSEKLYIVGDGPLMSGVRRRFSHSDRIVFTGWQSDSSLIVGNSRFLLLSSRHEGYPMVILEAFAMGTPVIALDCSPGVAALVQDGTTGFLVGRGHRHLRLSTAIEEAIRMPDTEWQRLSQSARQVARDHSLEGVVSQWSTLLIRGRQ